MTRKEKYEKVIDIIEEVGEDDFVYLISGEVEEQIKNLLPPIVEDVKYVFYDDEEIMLRWSMKGGIRKTVPISFSPAIEEIILNCILKSYVQEGN